MNTEKSSNEEKGNGVLADVMLSLLAKVDEEISCYERFRERNKPNHENDSVAKEYANKKIEITGREQAEDNWFNNINGLRNARRIIVETFANNGA